MAEGLPSLDLIASLVEAQQAHQLRHFDGLANKAGIVLGFAGVLVAIADGFETPGDGRQDRGSRGSPIVSMGVPA